MSEHTWEIFPGTTGYWHAGPKYRFSSPEGQYLESDARLIASAPDLLAALEKFYSVFHGNHELKDDQTEDELMEETLGEVREAVHKARGS